MNMGQRIWENWKRIAQLIGDFIGRIILTGFYFTLFMPFGLGVRFFGDHLNIKSKHQVDWVDRTTNDLSMEDVRRLS